MLAMFAISCGELESDAKKAGRLLCESKIAENNGDDAKAKKLRDQAEKIQEKYEKSSEYSQFKKIGNLEYMKCGAEYKQKEISE